MNRSLIQELARFGRDSRGTSAVEFAIVAIPTLTLVLGAVEYGRYMWTRTALERAAIAGARCIGLKHSACALDGAFSSSLAVAYIRDQASSSGIRVPTSNVVASASATCFGLPNFSQVTVTYSFQSVAAPFFSAPGGIPIETTSCFPNN